MTTNTIFVHVTLFLLILTIIVQSIPIEKPRETPTIDHAQTDEQELLKSVESVKLSTDSSTTINSQTLPTESTIKQEKNDHKSKRNIINNDQFDEILTSESDESSEQSLNVKSNNNNIKQTEHILHAKIQETPVKIHENADIDTDDSKVYSDIQMTPNELTDIVRRRRNVKLNMESNQRRKRALSTYDLYDTDSLYDPYVDLTEGHRYVRPTRAFAPIYWYPNTYERNIRAALAPSFYESSEQPRLYSVNSLNNNDDDDNLVSLYGENNDDNSAVIDYELNRYPILLESTNNPFDNLQLQQRYNTDDLPIYEDIEENFNDDEDDGDNDEAQYRSLYENYQYPYYTRYGSLDTYFE